MPAMAIQRAILPFVRAPSQSMAALCRDQQEKSNANGPETKIRNVRYYSQNAVSASNIEFILLSINIRLFITCKLLQTQFGTDNLLILHYGAGLEQT